MRPRDIQQPKIDAAIEFVCEPLASMFNARNTLAGTLRNQDYITLSLQQLGHLMAWYREVSLETVAQRELPTVQARQQLPERTE